VLGIRLDFPAEEEIDGFERERLSGAPRSAGKQTNVSFLRRGSAITADRIWEFVPYNDDPKAAISSALKERVTEARQQLLATNLHKERRKVLAHLRAIYGAEFGNSSEDRNAISLFLYSGPIYSSCPAAILHCAGQFCVDRWKWLFPPEMNRPRCSLLYTGDGYLDTSAKLLRLLRYLEQDRVDRTGIFQVMHHGAETN
jgi:hypothetical protein